MARSLGVQVAPRAGPDDLGLGGLSVLVNALSILLDIAPLFVLMIIPEWKEAKKFFTLKGFALGAIMNLMLVVHVLFVSEDEHLDVLFVATVGLCLGATYTFFLLGHRVVTNERASNARYWMLLVLVGFVIACYAVFCGIFMKYRAEGRVLNMIMYISVGTLDVLTLLPILTCKPFPDQEVTVYTWGTCIFNTMDAAFFVAYAFSLGSSRKPLSIVSLINAACGVMQLTALAVLALQKVLRKFGATFRSWGDSCCGLCRFLATLFEVLGRHERTD